MEKATHLRRCFHLEMAMGLRRFHRGSATAVADRQATETGCCRCPDLAMESVPAAVMEKGIDPASADRLCPGSSDYRISDPGPAAVVASDLRSYRCSSICPCRSCPASFGPSARETATEL